MEKDLDRAIELLISAASKYGMKKLAAEIYPSLKITSANSRLDNELNERDNYKLGVRESVKILQITGDLSPLDALEEMFGRVAFFTPRPEKGGITDIITLISKLTKEFGENMEQLAEGIADGKLDKKEAEKCMKENKDLIRACVQLHAYLLECMKG